MADDRFYCGVSRGDISPDDPAWLTPTGMVRLLPTRGVLDPVEVQALAFEVNGKRACVVTTDLRIIESGWARHIRQRLSEVAGCDPECLILSATHNHCSNPELPSSKIREQFLPANRDDHQKSEKALEAFRQKVVEVIVETCVKAFAGLQLAEIASFVAPVKETLGQNRRMRLSTGICVTAWGAGPVVLPGMKYVDPAGASPDRIHGVAIRQIGADKPFAVLTSYNSHIHLYEVPYFSGEVAGAARQALESKLPGVTALYASGASGDVDMHCLHPLPLENEQQRIDWFQSSAKTLGERFATAVHQEIAKPLNYQRPATLSHAFRSVGDEVPQTRRRLILSVLKLGDIAMVSMPGEMFIDFARQLHASSPDQHLILMAYNGSDAYYIPTPIGAEQGGYEVMYGPALTPDEELMRNPSGELISTRKARPGIGGEIVAQLTDMLHAS